MKSDRFISDFATKERLEIAVSEFLIHLQYLFDIEALEFVERSCDNKQYCEKNHEAITFLTLTKDKVNKIYGV